MCREGVGVGVTANNSFQHRNDNNAMDELHPPPTPGDLSGESDNGGNVFNEDEEELGKRKYPDGGDGGDGGDGTTTTAAATRRRCDGRWPEEEEEEEPAVVAGDGGSGRRRRCCVPYAFSHPRHALRCWTYSYMNAVLDKGSRQKFSSPSSSPASDSATDSTTAASTATTATSSSSGCLVQEDLYPVPKSMESEFLADEFWRWYNSDGDEGGDGDDGDEGGDGTSKKRKRRGRKGRLTSTLLRLAAPTFVPAGFCQLVAVLMQVTMPLLVRELLTLLENNPSQKVISRGLPYAFGIFLTLFVNAFANHRHRHLAMKTGVVMRAAVVSVLYGRVLRLTPRGRAGLTSGEVANLIAVDTQKLFEVSQEGHLIWSLPLSMVLVTVCLVVVSGPVTLVGIAVLIMFVPLVERITSRVLQIRQERVGWTDRRIEVSNAMLQGMKVTKLNNYEENYEKRVSDVREKEVSCLRRELAVWAMTLFMTVISPVVATAATFSIYVLVDENNVLTAAQSFSVLLLFSALRFPINYAGRFMGKAAQALSAMKRITAFLQRETRSDDDKLVTECGAAAATDDDDADPPLSLTSASFRVGSSVPYPPSSASSTMDDASAAEAGSSGFTVSKFDFTVKKGEVLAVCGPVGSGKSCLVNGIIDEVPAASSGTVVSKKGSVAYVPQTPFILNTTIRENILFGLPFEQDVYDKVLDACCLRPDLEQLGGAKDLTEIGERGVTLSGGQKQRVSLARAAYSRPDLVLLDDPLSALDAGTAKMVFERLIKSPSAYFSETAVVLVTHAAHILNRVDRVMVIVDGQNKFLGSWVELVAYESDDPKTKGAVDFIRNSVQEAHSGSDETGEEDSDESGPDSNIGDKKSLMTIEEREHGLSSVDTWLLWFRRAGGMCFLGTLSILLAFDRFMYVATEYWLAQWTQGAESPVAVFGIYFPPQSEGRSAQYKYLAVYALIVIVSLCATLARSEYSVQGGVRASRKVFTGMLSRVLRAPVSYFETTPMGRILNRFTYDMEVCDIVLTQNMSMFLISISWYFTGVILMCSILPYVILAIVPVTFLYYLLLLHYRRTGPDLQRLDAVSRSPIQAMITEGLDGSSTIRVFRKEHTFVNKFHSFVNLNSSALLNFVTAQRWLGVRIELLGSIIVLVSSTLIVCLNDVFLLEAGMVGLLIIWSSNFTITLGFLVDTFGEAEAAITAIERVDAMSRLPQERPMKTDDEHAVPVSWPSKGALEFENVCLRYREGLPLALNNLSFSIPPGRSCGVVGRTGAGKSSLTVALFRLVEIEAGRISLDGVDLSGLGLSDVRGRANGMTIIPQDPFLVGTTLRECLDPFGESDDDVILEALNAVRLRKDNGEDGAVTLDTIVQEGGSNYSVGERQLLNLARALLSKPKLLVLDEATASIDGETDAFIQKMLRTRFSDTTLITVAHRLNTIMDYDLILVMENGHAVQFGPPAKLLASGGIFSELVDATGPESAKALRAMAAGVDRGVHD